MGKATDHIQYNSEKVLPSLMGPSLGMGVGVGWAHGREGGAQSKIPLEYSSLEAERNGLVLMSPTELLVTGWEQSGE